MRLLVIVVAGMGVITTLTWMILSVPMDDNYPRARVAANLNRRVTPEEALRDAYL